MSNQVIGSGPKKETVYGGPSISPQTSPAYNRQAAASGGSTVYTGPTPGGTVHNGASPAGSQARPSAPASAGGVRGASIFYVIAGFTAANMVLMFAGIRFAVGLGATGAAGNDMTTLLISNLVAIGIFVLLGFLTKKGSKAAFIIGMVLYALDLLILAAFNPAMHVVSIVIHGLFLWNLFKAFRQLPA